MMHSDSCPWTRTLHHRLLIVLAGIADLFRCCWSVVPVVVAPDAATCAAQLGAAALICFNNRW